METRNYNRRQTKVRNVRNVKRMTWRERATGWRQAWAERKARGVEAAAGVEVPRIPWLKLLGTLGAVACLVQAVYALGNMDDYFVRTQQFHVAKFDVAGMKRVERQAIIDATGVKLGASLTALDPVVVQHNVESLPWVRAARVEAQLPSTLVVRVTEYQPFALLLSDAGKLLLVDRGGFVFKEAEAGEAMDLPIITGLSAGLSRDVPTAAQAASKELTPDQPRQTPTQRRLADLLRLIDTHAASPLAARFPLSEVHWDAVLGTTLLSANDGAEIRLGHALETDLGRAFSLAGRLLDRIDARGEWLQYALLDDELRQDRAVVRAVPLQDKGNGDQLTQTPASGQAGAPAADKTPQAQLATTAAGKARTETVKLPPDNRVDD